MTYSSDQVWSLVEGAFSSFFELRERHGQPESWAKEQALREMDSAMRGLQAAEREANAPKGLPDDDAR